MADEEKIDVQASEPVFSKKQLAASQKYSNNVDAINALLTDGKYYTMSEVDCILNDFLKREAK